MPHLVKDFIFPPQSHTLKINASIQDQALLSKVICFPSSSQIWLPDVCSHDLQFTAPAWLPSWDPLLSHLSLLVEMLSPRKLATSCLFHDNFYGQRFSPPNSTLMPLGNSPGTYHILPYGIVICIPFSFFLFVCEPWGQRPYLIHPGTSSCPQCGASNWVDAQNPLDECCRRWDMKDPSQL